MTDKSIAQRVKALRLNKGLSQDELAEKAGLSLRTVQRIENGETEPRGNSLNKLSEILGDLGEVYQNQTTDKSYLLLTNLSALSFLLFPFFGILAPLIIWISKRSVSQDLNKAGRKIINFQITWSILFCLSFLLPVLRLVSMFKTNNFNGGAIGSNIAMHELIIVFMYLYNIIFIIINTIRINREKELIYLPSIRFI